MPNKLLLQVLALACLPALVQATPAPYREKEPEEGLARGQTVNLGTWSWKIEGNQFGDLQKADFWWEQVDATERNLVPLGGAGWALLKDKPFEKITAEDLAK